MWIMRPRYRPESRWSSATGVLSVTGMANHPQPGTVLVDETKSAPALEVPWNVIVHNDPINLMTYVTHVFQRVFGYPRQKAEVLMLEVHQKGRSLVWSGAREQAEMYVHQLHAYQLLATMEKVSA
jgi:ATP-dependent Clp protease adaptor protein ClpS